MSAADNLGKQWVQPELSFLVHRGLHVPRGQKLDLTNVGTHWSHDQDIAEAFSSNPNTWEPDGKSYVIHGEVPISSMQDNAEFMRRHAIRNNPGEKELPVRSGAPLSILGITRITDKYGSRETRTFNEPQGTQA